MSQKTAFISIIGKANVGKSSLLNNLLGEKISIVSSKPQTTRNKITGILTCDDTQLVFIDTPGAHRQKSKLGEYMTESINTSVKGIDVIVLVVEAGTSLNNVELNLIKKIKIKDTPIILAINKIDILSDKEKLLTQIAKLNEIINFKACVPLSAKTGEGVNLLIDEIKKLAKEGPFLFSEDAITDQPERVIASEIIREKALRLLSFEIPHGIAVVIDSFKERNETKEILDINATIICEKQSHKAIIIGKHGSMLKNIGTKARVDLENFFNIKVNLSLWVKIKENWRNNNSLLVNFGFDKKDLTN